MKKAGVLLLTGVSQGAEGQWILFFLTFSCISYNWHALHSYSEITTNLLSFFLQRQRSGNGENQSIDHEVSRSKCRSQNHRQKVKSELQSLLSLSPAAKLGEQKDDIHPGCRGESPEWELIQTGHCRADAGHGCYKCLLVAFVAVNGLPCLFATIPSGKRYIPGWPWTFPTFFAWGSVVGWMSVSLQVPMLKP